MDLDMTEKQEKSNLDGSKPASKGKVSEQRKAEIKKELAEIERRIKEKKEEEKRQLKPINDDKILPREIEDNVGLKEPLNVDVPEDQGKSEKAIHVASVEK